MRAERPLVGLDARRDVLPRRAPPIDLLGVVLVEHVVDDSSNRWGHWVLSWVAFRFSSIAACASSQKPRPHAVQSRVFTPSVPPGFGASGGPTRRTLCAVR